MANRSGFSAGKREREQAKREKRERKQQRRAAAAEESRLEDPQAPHTDASDPPLEAPEPTGSSKVTPSAD